MKSFLAENIVDVYHPRYGPPSTDQPTRPRTPVTPGPRDHGSEDAGSRAVHPWPGKLGPAGLDAATPSPDSTPPFQSVGFTISTLGYEIARRFRETLHPLGIEPRDFSLLRAVASDEGRSQQAVGETLQIAPSRMVAFVDQLESRGLLERRQNVDDRRTRALHLTDAGRDLLGRAFALAVETERGICAELTPEDRSQLLELLSRVAVRLEIGPGVHTAHAHSSLHDA
jgi:DNA-binding MarR family transcriptional regulator